MVRTLRKAAIAAALLLAVGNAWALGLGQIEVKSRRNQPLLAEIPIISTTPGELEALQARLASPDTFRRVGLAPPSGIAADLQFSLGSDARGRPVIRVTTVKPVDQAALNFLIEVDWGQGRLVREYSALVDAPNTAGAPVQPVIEAPVVAAPNVVQRAPEPDATLAPSPAAQAAEAAPRPTAVVPAQPVAEPAPSPAPVVSTPAPEAAPAAATPAQYGPVKPGDTLSKIASRLVPGGYSLDQTMLALLRANPGAFLGDNINKLKRGAVLRVPESGEVGGVNADEAALVVREQMHQWRQARRPVAQPDVAASADAGTARASAAAPAAATETPAPATTAKPAAPSPRRQQARLEIVPPSAPGKATGTRSGTNAGGEGSMLQQQLRQKDEDIAAKAAEIGELKERVAELEKLKQDQAQLLSMKDTELAAAQQNLANARKAAVAPAANAAQTAQPAEKSQASNATPWLLGGLVLIGMALLAWWFARRGTKAPPAASPRRGFDSEALAASMVPKTTSEPVRADGGDKADKPQAPAAPPAAPRQEPARNETPNWHSDRVRFEAKPAATAPAAAPKPRFVPDEPHARPSPAASLSAAPSPPASTEQKMKLARAFLDIGDEHSAKELLRELLDGADPAARNEAARMLRELG